MLFEVIRDSKHWTKLVNRFEHDLYHTWDFHSLSHMNNEGVPVLFSLEYDSNTIVFPLLEREVPGEDKKDLISVYGYPGPLFSVDNTQTQNLLLNKLFEKIAELGYVSLFSRMHPIINKNAIEHSTSLGDIVYFDFEDNIDDIYAAMRKVHRRDIRKLKISELALKIHRHVSSEHISEFKHIYNLTMDKLDADDYYYFDQGFYEKMFASDGFQASLYTVYSEDKAIASAIMIQTDTFGEYHLSGTLPEFYREHPMKLILGCAMEEMHSMGLKYFILGGGVGSTRDSLFDFKYGFTRRSTSFSIMKKVFDQIIYNKLSEKHFKALNMNAESIEQVNYFPLYRYSR